jgi:hypothetical protein
MGILRPICFHPVQLQFFGVWLLDITRDKSISSLWLFERMRAHLALLSASCHVLANSFTVQISALLPLTENSPPWVKMQSA